MKKRAWITALGLLVTVSPAQAEENTSVTSYLNTMNQLYQFAWGQQYPMEGCA